MGYVLQSQKLAYLFLFINVYYCIKSRVARYKQSCFNWHNPMYESGNLRAVDGRFIYFTNTHFRALTKMTSSTVKGIEMDIIQ